MLKVKLKSGKELTFDIDGEFLKILGNNIPDTEINRNIINFIEQGKYVNDIEYIDRFGCTRSMHNMSTGCKAALLVANTDKVVDLQECGENAKFAIFHFCRNGRVVILKSSPTIATLMEPETPDDAEIEFNGYKFSTITRYNDYLTEEYLILPEPDYENPGVEEVGEHPYWNKTMLPVLE